MKKVTMLTSPDIDQLWSLYNSGLRMSKSEDGGVRTVCAKNALNTLAILCQNGALDLLITGYSSFITQYCDHNSSVIELNKDITGKLEALKLHQEDLELAAGELMVDLPEPGTVIARLLRANRLMRKERDQAKNELIDLKEAFYGNKN